MDILYQERSVFWWLAITHESNSVPFIQTFHDSSTLLDVHSCITKCSLLCHMQYMNNTWSGDLMCGPPVSLMLQNVLWSHNKKNPFILFEWHNVGEKGRGIWTTLSVYIGVCLPSTSKRLGMAAVPTADDTPENDSSRLVIRNGWYLVFLLL